MYLNSVQKILIYDATVPATAYINNSNTRIGFGPAGAYPYFNGSIANVNYYNRALSAAEVLQNYNALRGRYGL